MYWAEFQRNVALEKPRPAYTSEQPDGLLYRFAYDADQPCGVTVFHYQSHWLDRKDQLADRIAKFLNVGHHDILTALSETAAKSNRQLH